VLLENSTNPLLDNTNQNQNIDDTNQNQDIDNTNQNQDIDNTNENQDINNTNQNQKHLFGNDLNTTAQCIQILGIYKDKRNQEYSVFHIFIQHALIETVLSILPTEGILYMKDSPRMFEAPGVYISSR